MTTGFIGTPQSELASVVLGSPEDFGDVLGSTDMRMGNIVLAHTHNRAVEARLPTCSARTTTWRVNGTPGARVTYLASEVVGIQPAFAASSFLGAEVLATLDSNALVSFAVFEVVGTRTGGNARVSQSYFEVIGTNASTSPVGNARTTTYNVSDTLYYGSFVKTRWNTQSVTGSGRETTYRIGYDPVESSVTTTWNISPTVTVEAEAVFDVIGGVLVGPDQMIWDVQSPSEPVNSNVDSYYDINGVRSSRNTTYRVNPPPVSVLRDVRYNILLRSVRIDRSTYWDVVGRANKQVTSDWNTHKDVGNSRITHWDVIDRTAVGNQRTAKWNTQEHVSEDAPTDWEVFANLIASDIIPYYSVSGVSAGNTTGQSDPNLSFGNYVSTTPWPHNAKDDLFPDVAGNQNAAGLTDYRCIFIRNTHDSVTLQNALVWFSSQTAGGATATVGVDPTPASLAGTLGPQAVSVPNDQTAPAGVTFTNPVNRLTSVPLGDLQPGFVKAIWIKRTIHNGTPLTNDGFMLHVTGDVTEAGHNNRTMSVNGIFEEAFGTALFQGTMIVPPGIATQEALGHPTLHSATSVLPNGFNTESPGTPTVHNLNTVQPNGFAAGNVGTPSLFSFLNCAGCTYPNTLQVHNIGGTCSDPVAFTHSSGNQWSSNDPCASVLYFTCNPKQVYTLINGVGTFYSYLDPGSTCSSIKLWDTPAMNNQFVIVTGAS